jgi:hypothetical protein
VRSCDKADSAGRTLVIGLVTDPAGGLANAFASVKGTEAETVLAPIDALDSLSGFLGATLGEEQGGALLTWLASHLGDAFAETTTEQLKVATYTESADDHSTLYVEIANQVYLDASPAPAPSRTGAGPNRPAGDPGVGRLGQHRDRAIYIHMDSTEVRSEQNRVVLELLDHSVVGGARTVSSVGESTVLTFGY